MRILEVLPTYPGDPLDGSAAYERSLNGALRARGAHIEVLSTRADRLRHVHAFSIEWPDELPTRDSHDGIPVRRFHALSPARVGVLASHAITRRWSREDYREGQLVAGSHRYAATSVARARRRPARFGLLADVGRGPVVPALTAYLLKNARRFDVILAGYAPLGLSRQVLWAARRARAPVALLPFIHENDPYHQFESLLATYAQADAVLTLSEHSTRFLRAHVPGANAVTVGAGVAAATAGSGGRAFRERHGIGERPMLLFVGRKEHGKRYDMAVAAVELLADDAVLVMAGRDVDGRAIDSRRVLELGVLSDADLADAYDACDVFVLPSQFESFGMVFLEAWLRGKPVIGNAACGAVAALIVDGEDGYLCRDAHAIAASVRRLLDDPALARAIGAAGRAKTLAEYSWERVADRALAALSDVAGATARRPGAGAADGRAAAARAGSPA